MKYMWAMIQSCRSTTASLAEYPERWIANRLVFRDWAFERSYHVWTLIGVESTVCDLIVTLQLRVVGCSVLVAEDYDYDDQIVQKVSHVMGGVCLVVPSVFLAFVLGLHSYVVGGLVQLERDELLSDIDAAIDLHSGEAQEWKHKFHIVDGVWAWSHGASGLDDCSDIAVLPISISRCVGPSLCPRFCAYRPSCQTEHFLTKSILFVHFLSFNFEGCGLTYILHGLHAYPHSIFASNTALKFEVDWHDRYIAVIEAKASKIIASQADSSFGATVFSFVLVWTVGDSSVGYTSSPSLH